MSKTAMQGTISLLHSMAKMCRFKRISRKSAEKCVDKSLVYQQS